MIAADIMTKNVICIGRSTPVSEIAALLLKNKISAVPVIDDDGHVIGIVSEDDLLRRRSAKRGSWWLGLLASGRPAAEDIAKARDLTAAQVMTRHVITTREGAPPEVVSGLLRRHRIKRIPVVRRKKLVGIISRADLLNALFQGRTEGARRVMVPIRASEPGLR
jgi:CBS domain-containing protein